MADNTQLIHDVTCVFDDGKFILGDLPDPTPEVFTVRFTTPEVFTQGNEFVADGRTMNLRTPGGINASSAFFRQGTVFHCDIDFGKGFVYAWSNIAPTGTYEATASRLMQRNNDGRCQVADPVEPNDAATKSWVESRTNGTGKCGGHLFSQESGIFVVPEGVNQIKVTLTGGGGSGAWADSSRETSGGSGGGTAINWFDVTAGQNFEYAVGKGGQSVAQGRNGDDGEHSEFLQLKAYGGQGGLIGSVIGAPWIPGGNASGGEINLRGGAGTIGLHSQHNNNVGDFAFGGAGGASYWGPGGCGGSHRTHNIATSEDLDAVNPGAGGGSGGRTDGVLPSHSGKGADGCIFIEW